jgi:hypothetical protein
LAHEQFSLCPIWQLGHPHSAEWLTLTEKAAVEAAKAVGARVKKAAELALPWANAEACWLLQRIQAREMA